MTIKNNETICGVSIFELSDHSHKHIIRICDFCFKEDEIQYKDRVKQHQRRIKAKVEDKDTCFTCRYKLFPNPNKGKTLSLEHKKKLFDGRNKWAKNAKFKKIINGYAISYHDNKQFFVHRDNYAQHHNVTLTPTDIIHHINMNSLDNNVENLVKVTPQQHSQLHRDFEKLIIPLLQSGHVTFNHDTLKYNLSPSLLLEIIPRSLGFEDIAIMQKENLCTSRLDVDISTEIIRGVQRPVGLIASNMSTVCNSDFCIQLYNLGALGILHRANNDEFLVDEIAKISQSCEWVAGSIGVNDFVLAKKLINAGANILVVDIAHGFCDAVFDMAKQIKNYSYEVKVVIGNTTNVNIFTKGLRYIDGVKLGIAQGFACETKNTAGCTEKQFSAIFKFKQISRDLGIPVISDGAIREPADFTKAIAAGANSIMAGSIFARCPESSAEVVHINGEPKKLYAGMASRYVQEKWKGGLKSGTCAEGGVRYLPLGEPVVNLIERYSGALKSGITYAGGNDIKSFQDVVEFVRLS